MSTECPPALPPAPARRPRRAAAAANPHVQIRPFSPSKQRRRGRIHAAPTNTPEGAVDQPTVTPPIVHGIPPQFPTVPVRAPHLTQVQVPVSQIPSNVMGTSRSSSFIAASDQPTQSLSRPRSRSHTLSLASSSSLSRPTSPTSSTCSSRSQSPRAGPHSKSKRVSKRRKNDDDLGADIKKFFRVDSNKQQHCLFCEYVIYSRCSSVTNSSYRQLQKVKIYGNLTGSGNLRKHLYKKHTEDWFSSCDEQGIAITANDKELQSTLADYRQRHSQVSKLASDSSIARQKYTSKAFIDAIVEFIVADDQV